MLPSAQVYWHELATEEERAAFSAVPRFTGQSIAGDSRLAVAHRSGDKVAVLRVFDTTRTSFVALSRHFVQTGVQRAAAGVGGFTHVVWVV